MNLQTSDVFLPPQVSRTSATAINELSEILEIGCVIVDVDYRIDSWNDWLARASGQAPVDVVGKNLLDVFPEIRSTPREKALQRALKGEAIVLAHHFHEFMLELPAPVGFEAAGRMQQSVRLVPFVDDGEVHGVMILIQDVTERVLRERALNAAKEKAESASKTKSEFLAAISHELRTPLTAILGYADLLESQVGGILNSAQHDYISRIIAGAWHLIKIIEEILTFSSVEAKKYEVSLEPFNVADTINQTATLLEQQAVSKGLTLAVNIDDPDMVIETDPLKLRQILLNIVGNAIKFTEKGGVTLDTARDAHNIYIRIIDTGPGIPEKMRALVFEPFVQVDQSATRAKGGTGLGLPLSRNRAELLGGELKLERTSDQGSAFVLQLPRTRVRTKVAAS